MAEANLKHPNLKIFRQHGFIPQAPSGSNQVIGRCPFCGGNKKFFVNPETKRWDCKVCSHNGGYQMFLQQLVEHGAQNLTKGRASALSVKRGIAVETLEAHSIGFNPVNETYLIPVWDENHEEIYNIRIYKKDGLLMNSAGCKSALFGWWNVHGPYKTVWLCEGEWDAMVMAELLKLNEIKDTIVLAVPGVTTFKAEWTGYFPGKRVHVVYDNDHDRVDSKGIFHPSPGKLGMKKVFENVKTIAKSVDFIHWPRIYTDKFDISDLYRKKKLNYIRTYKQLTSMMRSKPPEIEYPEGQEPAEAKEERERKQTFSGPGMSTKDVKKAFTKWLYLKDTNVIDVTFGTIIANRIPGDPVWIFLIGPSGCGKSEMIMALDDAPRIFPISRITPHTLISGSSSAGGGDPSLIPKLDQQVLAVKDFTGVLDMQDQARDEVFGQLRDAYDGKCAAGFGTGAMRAYESRFGIVAGATDAIEIYLEGGTAMGERFLGWKFPPLFGFEEECLVMNKALDNTNSEEKDIMREELRECAVKVLDHDYGSVALIPNGVRLKIMALAYWVAKMRGTVMRNRYSKEIERRAYIEKPTRIAIQMAKLSQGIAMYRLKKSVSNEEYKIIKQIGRGTAPAHLEVIVRNMWQEDPKGLYTNMDLADILRLPSETCKRFAENLHQLGIVRMKKPKGAVIGSWTLSEETKQMIQLADIYH